MIKFFRHIRQRLLSENKFSKYLLYAIGEIFLVVIGILIALQINNWNEGNKNHREEINALKDLHKEFVQNKINLKSHIAEKEQTMQKWEHLFKVISNKQLLETQSIIERTGTGSVPFFSSHSTLNSLLSSGKIDKISNDSLKKRLASWKDITLSFQTPEERHLNFVLEMFLHYERSLLPETKGVQNNDEGFISPFFSKEERKPMLLKAYNNLQYQNLLLRNHYWLKEISQSGQSLLKEYDEILGILEIEIAKKQ